MSPSPTRCFAAERTKSFKSSPTSACGSRSACERTTAAGPLRTSTTHSQTTPPSGARNGRTDRSGAAQERGSGSSLRSMRTLLRSAVLGLLALTTATAPAVAHGRSADRVAQAPGPERVVSRPFTAGGYPGAEPAPGSCIAAAYDANFSESVLAAQPGSEQLAGGVKAYFNAWSTFKAYHTAAFAFGPGNARPSTNIVNGFDCVTTGTQAMPPSWTNVTDPNMAWDLGGRLHQLALPFNAYWGSVEQPNGDVYGIFRDDGGRTWSKGNGGAPVQAGPALSTAALDYLDKPWIAVNQVKHSAYANHVYGVWVQFNDDAGAPPEIHWAVSRDRGATWSAPQTVPVPEPLGPANPWPQIAVGADGAVQLTYVTYGAPTTQQGDVQTGPATIWSARSVDDGRTWTDFSRVATTTVLRSCCLAGSKVHDGVVEFLDASRDLPGHAYVVFESVRGSQLDVLLSATRDGGRTWSVPTPVATAPDTADRFQPVVASGPGGAVAVAWYDRRFACPNSAAVLPEHRGLAGWCIATMLRPYRDTGASLTPTRDELVVSRRAWDPYQPAQHRAGIGQLACEDPEDPCGEIFIGDYFGLAVTRERVQVLSASTAYPSAVQADEGGPIFYQQQLLATVPRGPLGLASQQGNRGW